MRATCSGRPVDRHVDAAERRTPADRACQGGAHELMRAGERVQLERGSRSLLRRWLIGVEATCLIGLLIAALLLDRQATDDATVVWASGRVGSADVHEPFTTSPTPDRGPGTTVPDAEAYARLGLPPPLTIAGAPVDRPAGSGPGIDEPYTTGPATTTGPQ